MSVFIPGQRLHDRFTLVERVGAGGMSEVWRASDDLLGRQVAVKALAAPLAADPALREATWREARAAARLTHPHVTQVHDYGEVALPGGGVAGYLVMELVQGQTLAARLAGAPLPWQEAVRVGQCVASALAAAHRLGVVHRDIKPGNVMLTETGVKVLDFGISSVVGQVETDHGPMLGTPGYAAPERRHPDRPVQAASDVYSLGVLLYETLTGRMPGPTTNWPAVDGLPDPVAWLCEACLSPVPAQRPSAAAVAGALAEVAGGDRGDSPTVPLAAGRDPATPLPVTRIEHPVPPARRSPRLLLAGLATVLVLVGLGAVLLGTALRARDPGTEPGSQPGAAGGPAGSPTAPAPSPTAPTASPTPAGPLPAGPAEVVTELDRAVIDLLNQRAISRDAHDDLRDKLDGLRDAFEEEPAERDEKVREKAEDLREEIDDLREDREIDQAAADRLTELLNPLLVG